MAIDSKKCLILYLDILGYRSWVGRTKSPDTIYRIFNEIYFRHELFGDMSKDEDFAKGFKEALNLNIVADSIVILLNLDNQDDTTFFVSIFLQYISIFIIEFISKTGVLLRGGLTCGQFVLKNILDKEGNPFVFSKAYNKAVELEEKAGVPKVLVDDSFVQEFNRVFNESSLERGFLKYENSEQWNSWHNLRIFTIKKPFSVSIRLDILKRSNHNQCNLDYYYKVEKYLPEIWGKKILLKIKNMISETYKRDSKGFPKNVKDKYFYFRNYHNNLIERFVRAQILDSDFQALGLTKFEVIKGNGLEYLGIVESSTSFFIKENVEPDIDKIMKRIKEGDFQGKNEQLAQIIKQRIESNYLEIQNLKIDIK